jgi:hypothetical protein
MGDVVNVELARDRCPYSLEEEPVTLCCVGGWGWRR